MAVSMWRHRAVDLVRAKRRRLETRLTGTTQLFGWGELTGEDYRCQITETRTMLAELPNPNKIVAFDRNRHKMVTIVENMDRATRPQLAELVQLLAEWVTASGRTVEPESIEWTPPARPFFEAVCNCGVLAPPDGPRGTRGKAADVLVWYATS